MSGFGYVLVERDRELYPIISVCAIPNISYISSGAPTAKWLTHSSYLWEATPHQLGNFCSFFRCCGFLPWPCDLVIFEIQEGRRKLELTANM
jgi:hypothetical protein